MPSANAIRMGRAFVELFADDKSLTRGLSGARAKLQAFGRDVRNIGLKVAALGAAVMAPMVAMAKGFGDTGSAMYDMSKRTGTSVEALSALKYAAEQTGGNIKGLEGGLRRMRLTIGEAVGGSKTAQTALAGLGLTFQDLQGLTPDKQFRLIADRISKISDPSLRAARAADIFGAKIGPALMGTLEGGAASLDKYRARAEKLGLIMSSEAAAGADTFGDAVHDLFAVVKMTAFNVGAALAPVLQKVTESLIDAAGAVTKFVKSHQGLIVTIFKVAAGVTAAGVAMVVFGYALGFVSKALGVLSFAWTAVVGVLHIATGLLGLILSPIGLVSAAIIALGAHLIITSNWGQKTLGKLGGFFAKFGRDVSSTLQSIITALKSGNLGAAMAVAGAFMELEWLRLQDVVFDVWDKIEKKISGVLKVGGTIWNGVTAFVKHFSDAINEILEAAGKLEEQNKKLTILQNRANYVETLKRQAGMGYKAPYEWAKPMREDEMAAFRERHPRETATAETEAKVAILQFQRRNLMADLRDQRKWRTEALRYPTKENTFWRSPTALNALYKMQERSKELTNLIKKAQSESEEARQEREKPTPFRGHLFRGILEGAAAEERQQKIADAEKRLADLQKQIADDAKKAAEEPKWEGLKQAAGDIVDFIQGGAGAGGGGGMAEAAKITAQGTFNVSSLTGLGGNVMQDRLVKASEKTAAYCKELVDQGEEQGDVYM